MSLTAAQLASFSSNPWASGAFSVQGMNHNQMVAAVLNPGTDVATQSGQIIKSSQGQSVDLSALAGGIGAGVFGILGFLSARKQNKAIAEAAGISMERVNLHITNMRVNTFLAVAQIAYDGQRALGNASNAIGARGISKIEVLMSTISDPTQRTTWNAFEGLRRQEQAAEHEKQNIAARATNNSVNEWAAAAKAAGGGFAIGVKAYTAIENAENAKAINLEHGTQYQTNLRGMTEALRDSEIAFDTEERIGALSQLLAGYRTQIQEGMAGLQRGFIELEQARQSRWDVSKSSVFEKFASDTAAPGILTGTP